MTSDWYSPYIHPFFIPMGGLEPIPASVGREAGLHSGQIASPSQAHTYTGRTCKLHAERPQPGFEPVTPAVAITWLQEHISDLSGSLKVIL